MADDDQRVVLVRHAETPWSVSGRHTGTTDIPLTDAGRDKARRTAKRLSGQRFVAVLTSPLQRAAETCRIAGFADVAQTRTELVEWAYGDYEGLTTAEIRHERPDWSLWRDGAPGGETPAQVAVRADRVVAELLAAGGDVAVFGHGHILRAVAARWGELDITAGERLLLDTGTVSELGWHRKVRVICRWNDDAHLR